MSEVNEIYAYLAPTLEKLTPSGRSKLSNKIARDVRQNNSKRIAAQQNPDGSAYAPRKKRLRDRMKGKVRGKMFSKIKSLTFLKTSIQNNAISIGFIGRIARIAKVHQYGLQDRAERNAPLTKYARRELLGLTEKDMNDIKNSFLQHLDSNA